MPTHRHVATSRLRKTYRCCSSNQRVRRICSTQVVVLPRKSAQVPESGLLTNPAVHQRKQLILAFRALRSEDFSSRSWKQGFPVTRTTELRVLTPLSPHDLWAGVLRCYGHKPWLAAMLASWGRSFPP